MHVYAGASLSVLFGMKLVVARLFHMFHIASVLPLLDSADGPFCWFFVVFLVAWFMCILYMFCFASDGWVILPSCFGTCVNRLTWIRFEFLLSPYNYGLRAGSISFWGHCKPKSFLLFIIFVSISIRSLQHCSFTCMLMRAGASLSVIFRLKLVVALTGQLADKPTRGQSTRGLDNSRTGQLADCEFLKIMELLYFICTLNLTLTITLTLSNIGSV